MTNKTPSQIQEFLDQNSHRMDNPVQFLGTEPNAARKNWDSCQVRFLISASWPYFHSAGNQSIPAVYQAVNSASPDYLADLSYLPETPRDMKIMEKAGVPVFGVESKHQMLDFDIAGTSISYMILFMNFCKHLSLSGIPLRSSEREAQGLENFPMLLVGGQAFCAPGAMEPVVDCVWLGEVEDEPGNGGISLLCSRVQMFKERGLWQSDRLSCYRELALEFSHLYFPRFVELEYGYQDRGMRHPSKRVTGYRSLLPGMPIPLRSRRVRNLDAVKPLTSAPLLFNDPGMGSGDLEVSRGCPAWCSFPLAAGEEIVTRAGIFRISDVSGSTVEVWTSAGWVKAFAEAHGVQKTQYITFAPADKSGFGKSDTCLYRHSLLGTIGSRRNTGSSVIKAARSPDGRCRDCYRRWARNAYYSRTGRPELVETLTPVSDRSLPRDWRLSSRTKIRQCVQATSAHGWVLVDGTTTHGLAEGDYVAAGLVQEIRESSQDYKSGWVHGMIFGDGSKEGGAHRTSYRIRLHGEKDQAHLWRFLEARDWTLETHGLFVRRISYPHHPVSPDGEPVINLRSSVLLKEYPEGGVSPEYMAGFMEGWLSADSAGRADETGARRLYSERQDARTWLGRFAAYGGWLLVGHSVSNEPTNFGERSAPLHTFTLLPYSEDRGWKVVSIEEGPREQVFCLTVPGEAEFLLASGIMSGNCRLTYVQKPYRQRSVQYSVDHAKAWQNNMGSVELSPFGPDFPMHSRKKELLLRLLTEVADEIDTTAMRIDDFIADNEYVMLQAVGGVDTVTLGLEGNSQRMRDLVGKGTSDADVVEAVTRGIRAGFRKFKLFVINNFPGEEQGDVFRVVSLARKLAAVRDELGQPNVRIQFSWTPLLIEAKTPFQWFAPTPPDHALIDVIDAFRELRIDAKIGTKAEPNKVALFQLCQRASREVGEAIVDVLEEVNVASWGGVPRDTRERLEAALVRHGFLNGLEDCFDERFRTDIFGWEFIDTGVSEELLWTTYLQMVEFLEGTYPETYDKELPEDYHGGEFIARCDEACLGASCGACTPADLKLRKVYIKEAELEPHVDMAAIAPVDLTSIAARLRLEVHRPAEYWQVPNAHWRYSVRRAGYRAAAELKDILPDGFNVAKRSVRFASDGVMGKDWFTGTDFVEFGITRDAPQADIKAFIDELARQLSSWLGVRGCDRYPASGQMPSAPLAFSELELDISEDSLTSRFAAWDSSSAVPLILKSSSEYFGTGGQEVNAKDFVSAMWAVRDGHRLVLRAITGGKVSLYQIVAVLLGKSGWLDFAQRKVTRVSWLQPPSAGGAALSGTCSGCYAELPRDLLGSPMDRSGECFRCQDIPRLVAEVSRERQHTV